MGIGGKTFALNNEIYNLKKRIEKLEEEKGLFKAFVQNVAHVRHYPRMDFERVADDARELIAEVE